ncbi:MAG: ComEC/Rec2 family competence protein, partial [Lachnospiraceae bacterium]|nr:ComEC/Rec2 family competence protein [Lachnospiraceae bacterium]
AMTVAALLILVQQPLYLTHSGFLFSFGAICSIGLLPEVSMHLPSSNKFLKALSAGAWVSFATLPVHLCFYYEFPPFSVLLNLIVIPCMGVLLISGVGVMAAAVVFLPLGRFAAHPGIWILAFYEKCCEFCMKLPGRRWSAGCPAGWQTAAFLGIFVLVVLFSKRLKRRQFAAAVFLAAVVLMLRLPRGLTITFLDVGQGDCICLEEGKRRFLIDGGSADTSDVDVYRIVPF